MFRVEDIKIYFNLNIMKKTQNVLDSIKFIDNLDLSYEELDRLIEELDSMRDSKEKYSLNF